MVKVTRTTDFLEHRGVKGMKWGYNDGQRNGRRTASELKKVQEMRDKLAKENGGSAGSGDVQRDYDEANNMLKYLGISLDLHSDDSAVAKTMNIYETMRDSKDNYKSQYDWLKSFSDKLSAIGYDMSACDKYLAENKDKLNEIKTGSGSGDTSSTSNKDTEDKPTSKKETKSDDSKSAEKKEDSSSDSGSKTKNDDGEAMRERQKKNASKLRARRKNDGGKAMREIQNTNASKLKSNVQHSYAVIQNGDELYHHGILGQKWGVRRYQNSDGSLTDEGRKRYSHMSDAELRSTLNRKRLEKQYKDLKVGRGTDISKSVETGAKASSTIARTMTGDGSTVTSVTNSVGKVAKDASKIADKAIDAKVKKEKSKIDLSDMSNEELQRVVNRMQMERELNRIESQDIQDGKKITVDTLQTIGIVASTAVSVTQLALLLQKTLNK